ncbi:MAG: hypothetical protein ACK52I_01545 [Pseudomonadota bacterium]
MSKLVLSLRREGSAGWAVTRRDGSKCFFASPLDAVMDLIREGEVLAYDMLDLGMADVAVAHA